MPALLIFLVETMGVAGAATGEVGAVVEVLELRISGLRGLQWRVEGRCWGWIIGGW